MERGRGDRGAGGGRWGLFLTLPHNPPLGGPGAPPGLGQIEERLWDQSKASTDVAATRPMQGIRVDAPLPTPRGLTVQEAGVT